MDRYSMTDRYRFVRDLHSELSHLPISQNDIALIVNRTLEEYVESELASEVVDILNRAEACGVTTAFRAEEGFGVTLYIGKYYLKYLDDFDLWTMVRT